MAVYFVNIVLILLFGYIFMLNPRVSNTNLNYLSRKDREGQKRGNRRIFCVLVSMQFILLSGLRDVSIGPDTANYKNMFNVIANNVTWNDVFENFTKIYYFGMEGIEPGFLIFEKICTMITTNYQVFLVIVALVFFVPFGILVYKKSSEPVISFVLFAMLFFSFFGETGIRQTISTVFAVLIGFYFIQNRKLIPFILVVALAFTIHKSSLVFLPFYWIANKKITQRYIVILMLIFPTLFIFKVEVAYFFKNLSGYADDYGTGIYAGAGTWNFTILLVLLTGVTLWRLPYILSNNKNSIFYINALFMALMLTPLTFVNPSAMRAVQFYSFFLVLLVPEIVLSFKTKNEQTFIYFVSIIVLIGLFFYRSPEYLFFWQGT